MNTKTRVILSLLCAIAFLTSAAISAFVAIDADPSRLVFGEWLAPVNINIEIDKDFTENITVVTEPIGWDYNLLPTSAPGRERVVIHTELRSSGFHRRLFLRLPKEHAEGTLKAIDNISVFIGNKVYYFTKNEVAQFEKSEKGAYTLFHLPQMYYTKSFLIKDWVNYYGELNIALKLVCAFFFSPGRFLVPWLFLCFLLFLYRKELFEKYNELRRKRHTAAVLLALITVFAFLLRINGFIRHSAWSDELYSASLAGNPNAPFLSVFMDNGNPPAYFLLLKYWFKLTGWNEASGTLLSVLFGTLACPALYLFLKKNFDKKTALFGAFFMAISGFAVEYSQEMRAYILKMALVPVIAFLFLRVLKKCSLVNLVLYVLPCMLIVNAHYYGILFVMANFVFYCVYSLLRKRRIANILKFLAANIVIALSFMPFFLYKLFVDRYDFSRDFVIRPDHALIFALLVLLTIIAFVNRKKIAAFSFIGEGKKTGYAYILCIPALVFMLSFLISFFKPMIGYRYLMPVNFPFLLSIAAAVIAALPKNKTGLSLALVLLLSNGIYESQADISGGAGYAYYRESRRYITLDAQAHPTQKAAMLDNAPHLAAYYHERDLPRYSPNERYDVIYVFNREFAMSEQQMYDELFKAGLDDSNMLKIIPAEEIVLFKLYP
ncbi:glycosyltransferase family 39 protein [Breznakiellaceae bacterium SP9]